MNDPAVIAELEARIAHSKQFLDWEKTQEEHHFPADEYRANNGLDNQEIPPFIIQSLQYVRWLSLSSQAPLTSEQYELAVRDEYEYIFHAEGMISEFGSWKNVLQTAGVDYSMANEALPNYSKEECIRVMKQALIGSGSQLMSPRSYHEYWQYHQELPNVWVMQQVFPREHWWELIDGAEEEMGRKWLPCENVYYSNNDFSFLDAQDLLRKIHYCKFQIDFFQTGVDNDLIEPPYIEMAQSQIKYYTTKYNAFSQALQMRMREQAATNTLCAGEEALTEPSSDKNIPVELSSQSCKE